MIEKMKQLIVKRDILEKVTRIVSRISKIISFSMIFEIYNMAVGSSQLSLVKKLRVFLL